MPTQFFEVMKILLALDSFKGTFSSEEIAQHIKCALPEHMRRACAIQVLSDGGEGFTQVLRNLSRSGSAQLWKQVLPLD